ncbi:MAG: protein kinase [Granulosicoccus sp.]
MAASSHQQGVKRWRTQSDRNAEGKESATSALDTVTASPVENKPSPKTSATPTVVDTPSSDSVQQSSAKTKAVPAKNSAEKAPVTVKPLDIIVPGQIGRYTIGRRIGSGTCGVVHQSLDNLLGREVAVKLSPVGEAHVSTGKVPGAQRAYQTEIIAAGRLTHPNIVTVYDAGQFEDLNYLVMEAVDGKSLKEYGKGKTLLPVGEALRIISACCEALDYSHKQGILHRDIKPANIMLSSDGSVKLLDFGIAVGLSEGGALKKEGPTLGTPNYMSPEQILGRELLAQSDFYSLATVLFELLTGRQLFKAKKVKDLFRTVVHQKAPRLTAIRPDLPEGLADVLAKALEKKPKARFKTGKQMAKAIEPFLKTFRTVEQRPLPQQRLIKQLRQQAFFKTFSDMEVALLLERVKVRTYSPNEDILRKGDQVRRLLVVTDGVVKCMRNKKFAAIIGPGECVGETGFINGIAEPRNYSALSSVSVLEFSTEALAQLPPKVHLHYYRHISDILVDRLARRDRQTVDLVLQDPE